MSSSSIFSKIVRKEDDFTQLLCNFMKRDDAFRSRVLSFLFPDWEDDVQPNQIHPQADHQENGRTDFVIETKTSYAIVEIKTSAKCGITPNQNLQVSASDKGYLKILRELSPQKKTYLTFLVPQKWKFLTSTAEDGASLHQEGIEFNVTTWQRLLRAMDAEFRRPLLEEFRLLLIEKYVPTSFTQKEADAMFDKSFSVSAVRKLEKLIDAISEKAEAHTGYILEPSNGNNDSEYDFYLSKRKDKEYVFYFGYWEKFTEKHGKPICFGVEDDPELWVPGLKKALLDAYPEAEEEETYTLGSISKEDLYATDPVERVWERILPVLDSIRAFAGK